MNCPHCTAPFLGFTGVKAGRCVTDPPPPSPGDVGFCPECGDFAIVDDAGQFRAPTMAELAGIKADPMAEFVQDNWHKWMRESGRQQ